jgi:hypothetical protein
MKFGAFQALRRKRAGYYRSKGGKERLLQQYDNLPDQGEEEENSENEIPAFTIGHEAMHTPNSPSPDLTGLESPKVGTDATWDDFGEAFGVPFSMLEPDDLVATKKEVTPQDNARHAIHIIPAPDDIVFVDKKGTQRNSARHVVHVIPAENYDSLPNEDIQSIFSPPIGDFAPITPERTPRNEDTVKHSVPEAPRKEPRGSNDAQNDCDVSQLDLIALLAMEKEWPPSPERPVLKTPLLPTTFTHFEADLTQRVASLKEIFNAASCKAFVEDATGEMKRCTSDAVASCNGHTDLDEHYSYDDIMLTSSLEEVPQQESVHAEKRARLEVNSSQEVPSTKVLHDPLSSAETGSVVGFQSPPPLERAGNTVGEPVPQENAHIPLTTHPEVGNVVATDLHSKRQDADKDEIVEVAVPSDCGPLPDQTSGKVPFMQLLQDRLCHAVPDDVPAPVTDPVPITPERSPQKEVTTEHSLPAAPRKERRKSSNFQSGCNPSHWKLAGLFAKKAECPPSPTRPDLDTPVLPTPVVDLEVDDVQGDNSWKDLLQPPSWKELFEVASCKGLYEDIADEMKQCTTDTTQNSDIPPEFDEQSSFDDSIMTSSVDEDEWQGTIHAEKRARLETDSLTSAGTGPSAGFQSPPLLKRNRPAAGATTNENAHIPLPTLPEVEHVIETVLQLRRLDDDQGHKVVIVPVDHANVRPSPNQSSGIASVRQLLEACQHRLCFMVDEYDAHRFTEILQELIGNSKITELDIRRARSHFRKNRTIGDLLSLFAVLETMTNIERLYLQNFELRELELIPIEALLDSNRMLSSLQIRTGDEAEIGASHSCSI